MVEITYVSPKSRAEKVGIIKGDILLTINGREINDVLDYRFHLANQKVVLNILRNGEEIAKTIIKSEYDDIGLDFATPLMDNKHSCENKCIFCFIDQLPKGLRKSLYFKDDDSRLSFLHGNYITLTNLEEKDIDRIIEMHISPINISVHTTNPELRVKMMHNKRAGEVLSYIKKLSCAGIEICAQIVLCKGINDKDELERSMRDLECFYPSLSSVSIVPAGLTKFRDKLYALEPYSKQDCRDIIAQVTAFGDRCKEKYGTRIFYCADELYIKAEYELPDNEHYEEYAQIENGVGMLTSFKTEIDTELEFIEEYLNEFKKPRNVTVATGYSAVKNIKNICNTLENRISGLKIIVCPIKNNFFGENITVSGLITATDIIEQLRDKNLGDELLFPLSALRSDGDLFLDGKTPNELSSELGIKVRAVDNCGESFIRALLGIN